MQEKIKQLLIGESPSVLLRAVIVAGLLIALRLTGLLQLLEWAALDQFFRLRPQEPADSRVVIVGISESDIQKVGQWPIPDTTIAQLIEKLKQQQPSAIGLDIYRDLPVGENHQNLIKVLKSTPNLIGVKTVSRDGAGFAVNPSPVLNQLGQVGFNNLVLDPDGKLRRGLLFIETKEGETLTSFGLRLAFIYLENKGIRPQNAKINSEYLQLSQAVFVRLRANDGSYIRMNDQGYQILMNFRGPRKTFQIVSMTDVLENRVSPDFARNRVVLIGSTAVSLQDYFQTPYDSGLHKSPNPTSGVEIHANLTSQIISAAIDNRPLIKVWSEPLELLWIFGWSIIGATSVWIGRYAAGKQIYYAISCTGFMIIIAGTILIGGSFFAFLAGWWIPLVPAVLGLAGSASVVTAYIANIERAERQAVMSLFGRHVTPKIAEAIWQNRDKILTEGQLQGQEMIATVLFTDLKGFSSIAEAMEPKALMSWLNEYMSAMAQIVLDNDGVIDKFIGDAVMAVFGVPIAATTIEEIALDTQKAVTCALGMAEALQSLNRQWRSQGKPTVAMRVGIATGTVVVGSLGSNQRQDYTIIGDTVNIASRLESFDKSIDGGICRILIAEETCQYTQDKFPTKLIGTVVLKGREQPVKVYQVPVE